METYRLEVRYRKRFVWSQSCSFIEVDENSAPVNWAPRWSNKGVIRADITVQDSPFPKSLMT